jgi:hypothetical protein
MSFREAVFPKSPISFLEKLRENRDLHSVVTVHVWDVFFWKEHRGGCSLN